MKFTILSILSVLILKMGLASERNFEEAMDWYNKKTMGAVGVNGKPEYINKAINLFERALAANENELETGIYLMRSYIWKARFTLDSKSDKRNVLKAAKELGDKLVPKYPNSRELRFEYLSAMGQWGEVLGVFTAAKEGVVDKVKKQMEALIALDADYRDGVPKRALAVLHLRVPKIPFLMSWPDKEEALELTTYVIRKFPNNIGNNFYHAEALVKNDREEEAIGFLKKTLAIEPEQKYLLEDRHFHMEARQLLAKIQD